MALSVNDFLKIKLSEFIIIIILSPKTCRVKMNFDYIEEEIS